MVYFIKHQKAENAQGRGLCVPWAVSLWHKKAGVESLWKYFITLKLSCLELCFHGGKKERSNTMISTNQSTVSRWSRPMRGLHSAPVSPPEESPAGGTDEAPVVTVSACPASAHSTERPLQHRKYFAAWKIFWWKRQNICISFIEDILIKQKKMSVW